MGLVSRPPEALACFGRGFDVLAQAIDSSLTVVFLLTNLVLAASLAATAAGVALSPPL